MGTDGILFCIQGVTCGEATGIEGIGQTHGCIFLFLVSDLISKITIIKNTSKAIPVAIVMIFMIKIRVVSCMYDV